MNDFLRDHQKFAESAKKGRAVRDPLAEKRWPCLFALLSVSELNGKERQTATLNLFCEDGYFKAFLNDREFGRYACVSARTSEELLDRLESDLASRELDWREDRKRRR